MGMQILESKDLVNWRYLTQIYQRLDMSSSYDDMTAYAHGSWAPSLRFHNGRYYVYFCTPGEGLYMTSSESPAGPWDPIHEVLRMANLEDPCPFWDDDGTAWLGHSTWGAGPIIIHQMSPDGRELLDDGKIVYVGKVAEGTKILKRNGWYYLSIPEGGVVTGWQTVLRSRDILGPYEKKIALGQGQTTINGPHQGSIIETLEGEHYFIHFQDRGAIGRVCHLQPVEWVDDWPEMGVNGEPVEVWKKPVVSAQVNLSDYVLTASDDFRTEVLGTQWQWNHNPVLNHVEIDSEHGILKLEASPAMGVADARNTLTQKLIGEKAWLEVSVSLSEMADGQCAGLAFLRGKEADCIEIMIEDRTVLITARTSGHTSYGPPLTEEQTEIMLGASYNLQGETYFFFKQGDTWHRLGTPVLIAAGQWKGCRPTLYTYMKDSASRNRSGVVGFSEFIYEYDRQMKQM